MAHEITPFRPEAGYPQGSLPTTPREPKRMEPARRSRRASAGWPPHGPDRRALLAGGHDSGLIMARVGRANAAQRPMGWLGSTSAGWFGLPGRGPAGMYPGMAARRSALLSDLPRLHPETRAAWRAWLRAHHRDAPGCWLVTWKKETGKPRVEYGDAVEELICFGWVDSKVARLDARRSMLLCTPRRPGSAWSRPNKERVERLLGAGLMAAAGIAAVEAAKASGRWSALDAVEDLVVPPDLAARLDALPPARANWEAFPRSVRRGILEWLLQARRPETRARRVEETAASARRNVRANQWRPSAAPRGRRSPAAFTSVGRATAVAPGRGAKAMGWARRRDLW